MKCNLPISKVQKIWSLSNELVHFLDFFSILNYHFLTVLLVFEKQVQTHFRMIIFLMILGCSKMIKFRKSRITRGKNVPTMVFSKFANLPSYSSYKSVFFVVAIFNFFVHLKFRKRLFLLIFNGKVIFIFNCNIKK